MNHHLDLKDLVAALLTIVLISIGIGQFDKLHAFAQRQAMAALKPWPAHPFFPKGYEVKVPRH